VKVVFASATCVAVVDDGSTAALREGEPWAADDPFVLSRPDLFSDEPPAPHFPRRTVQVSADELATGGPGETRSTRRRG
jgi:hypothetical protein